MELSMELVHWWIIVAVSHRALADGISPKLDFSDDSVIVSSNTSQVSSTDEDIELKHTIVVSTNLKNNRAIHSSDDDGAGLLRPVLRKKNDKRSQADSGEVPIVNGYRALESTQIRSIDTRTKPKMYPDAVFVNYNINPDGFDVYPENAADPRHWKPSAFYNNINWKSSDTDNIVSYNLPIYTRPKRPQKSSGFNRRIPEGRPQFNRRLPEEGMKEYYCCKCREMQGVSTVKPTPYPWHYEATTKMKLDGKLAKLD